ncbi:MAG: amino acid permease, partial [Bacillus sp. (in: firmicutes)]
SGLFPAGFVILFVTMMNVIFSYQGSELIGIAAGESEEPEKNIPRAIRNVLFRIIVFYLASIVILSAIFPSKELGLLESPFVTLMDMAGIPFAPDIMNFVILTAILSVGNSCIYASTRLLWAMAQDGMAPKRFGKLSKRKVPFAALVFTMVFSLLSLLTSFIAADTVFVLLMSIAGISVTISWIGIALSQLLFRRKYLQDGGKLEELQYKVPFYPLIPIICIVFCVSILIFLAFDPTQLVGLLVGLGFLAVCYISYYFKNKKDKLSANNDVDYR